MSGSVKDGDWISVAKTAAGDLNATFDSSVFTGTGAYQRYRRTNGAFAVEFRVDAVTLGTAAELRITPKFKALDGTTITTPQSGAVDVYHPMTDADKCTEPFGPIDSEWVTAELWTDVDGGGTATATVSMKRHYRKL